MWASCSPPPGQKVIEFNARLGDPGTQVLLPAGGRVLTVVGRAASYQEAIARAYAGVSCIQFDGMQYRTDIGRRAIV